MYSPIFPFKMHIHSSLWTSFRSCVMDIHLSAPETSMLTKTIGTNNSSGLSNHSNGDLSFFSLGKMAGSVLRCQHFLAIIYTMLAAKLSVQRNSAPLSIVLWPFWPLDICVISFAKFLPYSCLPYRQAYLKLSRNGRLALCLIFCFSRCWCLSMCYHKSVRIYFSYMSLGPFFRWL